jgi:hypothetical protein
MNEFFQAKLEFKYWQAAAACAVPNRSEPPTCRLAHLGLSAFEVTLPLPLSVGCMSSTLVKAYVAPQQGNGRQGNLKG